MRKEEIAEGLLSIQAVFLRPKDPFTWASGIHSPIYCDNRLTLSFPEVRRKIEAGLAELVKEHFPEAKALFGTSTAGIAHAALTAPNALIISCGIRERKEKPNFDDSSPILSFLTRI